MRGCPNSRFFSLNLLKFINIYFLILKITKLPKSLNLLVIRFIENYIYYIINTNANIKNVRHIYNI